MSKTERQARYELDWRNAHRPTRRFKRAPRPYWQENPYRNHWYQRQIRARQRNIRSATLAA